MKIVKVKIITLCLLALTISSSFATPYRHGFIRVDDFSNYNRFYEKSTIINHANNTGGFDFIHTEPNNDIVMGATFNHTYGNFGYIKMTRNLLTGLVTTYSYTTTADIEANNSNIIGSYDIMATPLYFDGITNDGTSWYGISETNGGGNVRLYQASSLTDLANGIVTELYNVADTRTNTQLKSIEYDKENDIYYRQEHEVTGSTLSTYSYTSLANLAQDIGGTYVGQYSVSDLGYGMIISPEPSSALLVIIGACFSLIHRRRSNDNL